MNKLYVCRVSLVPALGLEWCQCELARERPSDKSSEKATISSPNHCKSRPATSSFANVFISVESTAYSFLTSASTIAPNNCYGTNKKNDSQKDPFRAQAVRW